MIELCINVMCSSVDQIFLYVVFHWGEGGYNMCAVNLVLNNSLVSDVWLQEIKETTTKDQSMQMLRNLIQFGWPEKQSQVPKKIQEYWNIRDQLSEVDGILLKN